MRSSCSATTPPAPSPSSRSFAPANITDRALFVVLHPRWFRSWWKQKVEQLNAKKVRSPWMDNRLVLYSLAPPLPQSPEPPCDPSTAPSGVWC